MRAETAAASAIPPAPRSEMAASAGVRWGAADAVATTLVAILGFLVIIDRLHLCREFLFRYTDEDQAVQWLAAHNLLHGFIPEPCFYGQCFNSCLEGMLAAPLVAFHVPYWVAVPLVSVSLALFPFFLMGYLAWRVRRYGLAALSLLVPLALPARYAVVAGMPRGFVTGVALAIVPAVMLVLDRRNRAASEASLDPRRAVRKERWRYSIIGALAVIALMLNPNSSVLLAAAGLYAALTHLKSKRFWIFAPLGMAIGAIYPLWVYFFYYILHDDYRMHHRDAHFGWTLESFNSFIHHLNLPLGDFVPAGLPGTAAAYVLGGCFAAVIVYLLLRRQWAAAVAGAVSVGFIVTSFAYERVHDARTSVFYPYSRMYLAVPVLLIWLLFVTIARAPRQQKSGTVRAWLSAGMALLLLAVGVGEARYKYQTLPSHIAALLKDVQVVRPVEVADARAVARQVQTAADAEHAHFVLLAGSDKAWDYLLPVLTDCQTLYPHYERRTWRLHEESFPRYPRILTMDDSLPMRARLRGYGNPTVDSRDPFIGAFDTNGESVIHICQRFGLDIRSFDAPTGADILRSTH